MVTDETYRRTVKVPVKTPTANKAGRLNWAMKEFRRVRQLACDWYESRDPFEVSLSDQSDLYQRIRREHDVELQANTVSQAVSIVDQNYREYAKNPDSSPPDANYADYLGLHSQVARLFYSDGYYLNVDTGRGRVALPLHVSDDSYHQEWLPEPESIPDIDSKWQRIAGVEFGDLEPEDFPDRVVKLSSSTLHRTGKREYCAHLVFQRKPERPKINTDRARFVVGVDRGRNQLVYAALYDQDNDHVSDWWNRTGSEVEHYLDQFEKRIAEFQQAGVWENKDAARERRRRYKEQIDYEIANSIVDLANTVADEGVIIALERLEGMSSLGEFSDENRRFTQWSYYRQAQLIEQKAEQYGVPVVEVDPSYTSQDCSRCGCRETERSGIHFECAECGYQQHSDANAAVNIAKAATEETA